MKGDAAAPMHVDKPGEKISGTYFFFLCGSQFAKILTIKARLDLNTQTDFLLEILPGICWSSVCDSDKSTQMNPEKQSEYGACSAVMGYFEACDW